MVPEKLLVNSQKAWFRRGPGRDPEVLNRPVLEPPTDLEESGQDQLNATDVEIFRHKLDSIVDEGREVFKGLAMSETLQIGDDCVSLFTGSGDMVATATGVYFHALLNSGPIKYILKHYTNDPTVGVHEGDIFFFNETLTGTIHPYDMWVVMPIFWQDHLIAWTAAGGHQGEAGSKDPGGFSPTALNRYEEGIHIPPLKIGRNFTIHTDQLDMLANQVRNPVQLSLDIKTRVAVCVRLRERILREVEKRGAEFVAAGMRQIILDTGQKARQRLAMLNDGVYRSVVFLDSIGTEDGLLRVPVKVVKQDDRLIIDYSGASPQHNRGPSHMFWHIARADTAVYLFTYVFRGLPLNIGLYDPVEVIVPPRSFINASEDVAHGQASFTGRVLVQALHIAGSKMTFDSELREVTSAPFAANNVQYNFGGIDQYGSFVAGVPSSINAQGQGARCDMDGEHTMGFFWAPEVDCLSAEECEAKFPFLYLSRNLFDANLHGYGKYRGGVGMTDIFTLHNVPGMLSSSIGQGSIFSLNYGLFGGYSGPTSPRFVIRKSDIKKKMAETGDLPYGLLEVAKSGKLEGQYCFERGQWSAEPFGSDDVFIMQNGSGGGYGDVLERDPEAVARDLNEGLITRDIARRIYGVVVGEADGKLDLEQTEALRKEMRRERIVRGKPYHEFVAEWSRKRPDPEALKLYGDWPEPRYDTGESSEREVG